MTRTLVGAVEACELADGSAPGGTAVVGGSEVGTVDVDMFFRIFVYKTKMSAQTMARDGWQAGTTPLHCGHQVVYASNPLHHRLLAGEEL